VFGYDHVRGTGEQMMLHVGLVRHRAGAELVWDEKIYPMF